MHFWIDKRSSNLHNYGGGGNRGRGNFYSRNFGHRQHNPPPLTRALSNSSNNARSTNLSHSVRNPAPILSSTIGNNYCVNNGVPHPLISSAPTSDIIRQTSAGQPIIPMQNPNFNFNPMARNIPSYDDHFEITIQPGQAPSHAGHRHILRHVPGNNEQGNVFVNNSAGLTPQYMARTGADPVIGLAGQYYNGTRMGLNGGFPIRYPRSHNSSASTHLNQGRRRSSSSPANLQRRSSMNRWTYDPYNINHHQQQRHPHPVQVQMWPDGRPGFPTGASEHGDFAVITPTALISSNDSQQPQTVPLGTTNSSGSNTSINDPKWNRTKRIGLTLCFMSFVLLSTVAAKFVIEGPLLLDKSLRHERSEPTLYFFIIEFIFVLVAMALFFAGVTCLRKRTNAYLLRQFNQYIMQTSHGEGGFFDGTGTARGPAAPGNHHPMVLNPNQTNDRSFHPNFLPQLENHLLNMHISVAESSNFLMNGLGKPPPYHVALYLPAPGEEFEIGPYTNVDGSSKNRINPNNSQSSSWISSCLADNDNDKTEEEETEDEEGVEGKPKRKRKKNVEDSERPETPPPAYNQL